MAASSVSDKICLSFLSLEDRLIALGREGAGGWLQGVPAETSGSEGPEAACPVRQRENPPLTNRTPSGSRSTSFVTLAHLGRSFSTAVRLHCGRKWAGTFGREGVKLGFAGCPVGRLAGPDRAPEPKSFSLPVGVLFGRVPAGPSRGKLNGSINNLVVTYLRQATSRATPGP